MSLENVRVQILEAAAVYSLDEVGEVILAAFE